MPARLLCCLLLPLLLAAGAQAQTVLFEEQKLLQPTGGYDDFFGQAVAMAGNTALIGAGGYDNIFQNDGAVFYFRRSETGQWVLVATLTHPEPEIYDGFGISVALSASGEVALIGEPGDNERGQSAGAAHIYRMGALGEWLHEAKLVPGDVGVQDRVGTFIALSPSGDLAVLGHRWDNALGTRAGSAYLFRYDGAVWVQEAKLLPVFPRNGAEFGRSVAVAGPPGAEVVSIGAPFDWSGSAAGAGSVYVFRRTGGQWLYETRLFGGRQTGGESFGYTVSLSESGQVLAAGAASEFGGRAYVFRDQGSGLWERSPALFPQHGAQWWRFGQALALSSDGHALVVGAPSTEFDQEPGYAYLFIPGSGSSWMQQAILRSSDGLPGDVFGGRVAVDLPRVLVGAPGHDGAVLNSGAAYVFDVATLVASEGGGPAPVSLDLATYPNPSSGLLSVTFTLARPGPIRMAIHDLLGRQSLMLLKGDLPAGTHQHQFELWNLPSGIYLLRLNTGDGSTTRRLALLK